MTEKERLQQEKRRERRQARERQVKIMRTALLSVLVLIIGAAGAGIFFAAGGRPAGSGKAVTSAQKQQGQQAGLEQVAAERFAAVDRLAQQYDYEGAVAALSKMKDAEKDEAIQSRIADYSKAAGNLAETKPEEVTHVFFHSLVRDQQKAFFQDNAETAGYCQWMTTIDEFNRIIEQMHERGYVLVALDDLYEESQDEQGNVTMIPKSVMLPEGKIPFVLSLDDLSYYHAYSTRGIAAKLVLDKDGNPVNEYVNDDGSVETGVFDCVPLLDQFVEKHPDFSYRGAKGTIALTGYNGILGYRTDESYQTRENLDDNKQQWLDEHPDFDLEKERAAAKKVAEAIKANGWDFASHTWGHLRVGDVSFEKIKEDTEKWQKNVKPLVGKTDTIIFAHGQDLVDWDEGYSGAEKFEFLKSSGFNVFCTVDSAQFNYEITSRYVRMGRRNLDGYRIYQDKFGGKDRLSDLFDVNSVWDEKRPTDAGLYAVTE